MTTLTRCGETIETAELIVTIEQSWSTDFRIGVSGWCISKIGAPDQAELQVGGGPPHRITTWLLRPDVRTRYPQYFDTDLCGFAVQIDRMAEHCVTVRAAAGTQLAASELRIAGQSPTSWRDPSTSLPRVKPGDDE
jgi:hypothetical protein